MDLVVKMFHHLGTKLLQLFSADRINRTFEFDMVVGALNFKDLGYLKHHSHIDAVFHRRVLNILVLSE